MNRVLRAGVFAATGAACLGIGVAIGSGASHTTVKTVAGPAAVTYEPGPTVTVTASPPPPPENTVLLKFSASGNQATPSFTSDSGDYLVKWSYSGNTDPSLGGATNFIISEPGDISAPPGLPNDIQSSGSGSSAATGDTGSHSFDVQATGSWTITVLSQP